MKMNPATPHHPHSESPLGAAYPPRILAPGLSYWLDEGTRLELIPGALVTWRAEGVCYLRQLQEAKQVLVNGLPFLGERVLQDGDFIKSGQERFIFQADPVADRRTRLAHTSMPKPPKLSKGLGERVRIDTGGLSLDGGMTVTRWHDILSLVVTVPLTRSSQYAGGIRVGALTWGGKLAGELVRINAFDLRRFFEWAGAVVPFDPSIENPANWQLPLADAYMLAAKKLMGRVEAGQVDLPADRRFVLGEPVRFQRLGWGVLSLLAGSVWLFLLYVLLPTIMENARRSELIDQTGALTIGGILGAICGGAMVLTALVLIVYGLVELFRMLMAPSGR